MRELRVEDALMYLDQVKIEFGDRPHIYNEFLDIMKTFKSQAIDTPGVIRRVASLFHGNKRLVLGFNTFLPEGYRIELPLDGGTWPVYREPGRSGVINIPPPPGGIPQPVHLRPAPGAAGRGNNQQGGMGRGGAARQMRPPVVGRPGPIPGGNPNTTQPTTAASGGLKAPPPQQGQVQLADSSKQPVEFDHAINYVTTIKKRFAAHPEIYRKFLEILHTYQKEQRGIKEVLDEVSLLFADHADLLKEFTYFLPDQVQAQAKAQLDVAAKKAEERAAAREAAALAASRASSQQPITTPGSINPRGQQRGSMVLPPPPIASPSYRNSSPPQKKEPRIPSHVVKVPFGATKGRSEDREKEISRGAVHGVVSYDPVRPPRRHELSTTQSAQLLGRPTSIPLAPIQPMAAETAFFEHVKAHFLRKDLFPDRPQHNRRITPYIEFIKCLHLYGAGIINKDELILLLRGLFIQGNAPKSGANAPNPSGSVAATQATLSLLSELEKVLVGRGPFAVQEKNKKFKGKYGSYPLREYDLADASEKCTPSYLTFPKDYLFPKATGEDECTTGEVSTLNYKCFNIGSACECAIHYAMYDGVKARRNVYEEVLSRVEGEMYEVDMAIECNASAMRVLEPVAEEATRLREQEEKDGQPIGRLQYKLRNKALNSIQIGAIARIYGESGEEVLQHLLRNPLVVVPIVFKRLKEKNEEWRKAKKEMNKEWKRIIAENAAGSLDAKSFVYKKEIELSFTSERLLDDCQQAKSFAEHPSKTQRHPATNMILPDFHLINPDPELALFQPHISVLVSKNMPHSDAATLLDAYFESSDRSSSDKERFQKVLDGFVKPWFGLASNNTESDSTSKYTSGQRVRTAVGDGLIVSVSSTELGVRYLVKFSFGVGYVLQDAIESVLSPRSGSDIDTSADDNASQLMSDDVQVLFGTEKMYLFVRLYTLLVTMLYQAKSIADKSSFYSSIVSSLKDLLQGKIDNVTFEEECRKNVSDLYNFFAIPPLAEQCADALAKMIKEDCLESLYQCSQLKLKDLDQLRNLSLDMTEDAIYRLEIQSSASQVFFSYLPTDVELELTNPSKVDGVADDELKPLEDTATKRPLDSQDEPEQKRVKTGD